MKALVYGGGNIGRGFLGQLLYESGYETVFVDVNKSMVEKLNADGCYPIKIVSNEKQEEIIIKNVRAVYPDNAPDEIVTADIIFTSAGVNVLPYIAPVLKEGLDKRDSGVDVIICENLMNADSYLEKLVGTTNKNVGFVEASVGRMVPVMTDDMREGNINKVWVEPFRRLPVDEEAFKNPVPEIKNVVPSKPFAYHIQSKLYLHNMGHAIAAYMGMNKGYSYIWEAMDDQQIADTVKDAMYASATALALEHSKDKADVIAYADNLMQRFKNKYLGDTTVRVGRDAKRKLAAEDRFLGALALCQKHNIKADAIKTGIMAALDYLYEK